MSATTNFIDTLMLIIGVEKDRAKLWTIELATEIFIYLTGKLKKERVKGRRKNTEIEIMCLMISLIRSLINN